MAFKSKVKNVSEFMQLARERHAHASSVDKKDRERGQADARFESGEQWSESDQQSRKEANRPCLTENKLPVYVSQVSNDGRQNQPAIKAVPLDGGTPETAELFQGRIRHIEYESDADIAYDTVRDQVLTSGRGFLRAVTTYKDGSFDQEVSVEAIEDQFSVLIDPYAKKYDRRDAEYWFVSTTFSKDAFKRKFGKSAEVVRADFYDGTENPAKEWIGVGKSGEDVQVAEYWLKEYEERELCTLWDNSTVYADQPGFDRTLVTQSRKEQCCKVMQYVIDGVEIHDETEWLTTDVPIVPQWGRQRLVDGVKQNFSLIHFAKTPQILINLYVSLIAELTAMMPKTPWLAAVGTIPEGTIQKMWERINTDPHAYLLWNSVGEGQQPLPQPTRMVNEPPIQALTIGLNQAIDALKASMGIFDASLGARSNETAGIAIERRQKEADNANYHFPSNEQRSRKRLGRILIPLLKKLDRGVRSVSVRDEAGKASQVRVNTPEPYIDENGKTVHHQLDQGDYGVGIKTARSYTSQREEAADRDAELLKAVPELIWVMGDQYFRELDSPGADQRADRMERAINMRTPGLIDAKPKDGQQPIPPQVQMAIQKRDQVIEQLTQEVNTLADEARSGKVKIDSAERIKMAELEFKKQELQAEILLKQEEMGHDAAIIQLQEELANIRADIAHERSEVARKDQMAADAAAQAAQAPEPEDGGGGGAD